MSTNDHIDEDEAQVGETHNIIENEEDDFGDTETDETKFKAELFESNGITPEMENDLRREFGEIGWVCFNDASQATPKVYIFRSLTREEWRNEIKPFINQANVTQEDVNDYVSSYGVVYPFEARDTAYWATKGAVLPDTISEYIMQVSGAQPVTAPVKL